jgi:hypothetical protein
VEVSENGNDLYATVRDLERQTDDDDAD